MASDLNENTFLREGCFVDGRWIDGDRRRDIVNPATGAVIARVVDAGARETELAIAAAQRAFEAWRRLPAARRAACLSKMAEDMLAHEDTLGAMLTAEQGKPLAEAVGEVRYAASFLAWFAGEAVRVRGETIPAARADQRIVVTREPVGVCGLITPWNFPTAMLARKVGAALAAGCTVVCKPASETPLSALAYGVFAERAGVPPGVINVVSGPPEPIGASLLGSPAVRKLSFTGSTEVGKRIMRGAADTLKRVSLELGGNAPMIVFADADLERATAATIASKFRNAGQTCVCVNRVLLERGVAAEMTSRLVRAAEALQVGDGAAPGTQLGPLIHAQAVAKVRRLVVDALDRGATLVSGAVPDGTSRFVRPIVLGGVTEAMALWREEIFGPVLALRTFDDEAEAVRLANDSDTGLVAYLCSRDLGRVARVSEALEYGMVGVNEGIVSYAQAPFGGVKQSGFGREGSDHGMDEYLSYKYTLTTL